MHTAHVFKLQCILLVDTELTFLNEDFSSESTNVHFDLVSIGLKSAPPLHGDVGLHRAMVTETIQQGLEDF